MRYVGKIFFFFKERKKIYEYDKKGESVVEIPRLEGKIRIAIKIIENNYKRNIVE